MDYTDKQRQEISEALEGYEPEDVATVFYDGLVTLLDNDPEYFANGRGNSLAKTLEWTTNLIKEASEVKK